MKLFPYGHATHPQWRMAVGLVLAQLRAHMALPDYASTPRLGLVYITDHYAAQAQELLNALREELPAVTDWVGTVGVGIAANQVEYFDEPALSVMLCDLAPAHYRVFSGVAPLLTRYDDGFVPQTALVHADGNTLDVGELIGELAQRTQSAYLFGGLSSSRADVMQFALHSHGAASPADASRGVLHGGLSGVAFDRGVSLMSRVTQGCRPMGPVHTVTRADQHVVLELDGREALQVLTEDLKIDLAQPREAMPKLRQTLAGISSPEHEDALRRTGEFGEDVLVRHLLGLDTARGGVAVAHAFTPGMQLTFCERHAAAARADLTRICTEIREALEPEEMSIDLAGGLQDDLRDAPHPARRMAGAIYVSCAGRGGPHFGAPSAELQIVRRALGDVPLVGFFAGGEIAHQSLYGYTGVLTVFTTD
jgi:small ligand-binding sensory domain FIST